MGKIITTTSNKRYLLHEGECWIAREPHTQQLTVYFLYDGGVFEVMLTKVEEARLAKAVK